MKKLGTGSHGNVCLSSLTINWIGECFLLFKKKLNSFLKMKFWAACRTDIYYRSGTGKRKKIYLGVLKVKGDRGIFSCFKNFWTVWKRGILEEYESELFYLIKVSHRFLTTGVLWRAYMETYTIGRITFVKDPYYSLAFGRIPSLVCVVRRLVWGQDYVWITCDRP